VQIARGERKGRIEELKMPLHGSEREVRRQTIPHVLE
jgi:hypothetical protein